MKTTKVTNQAKPLTKKQTAFVQHLVDNPKDSATSAAAAAYNVSSRNTARAIATENLSKPAIISALGEVNYMIESKIINTIQEWGDHENPRQREIAMDVAKFAHDKIHGRATQRLETTSTVVTLNVDLTGKTSAESS